MEELPFTTKHDEKLDKLSDANSMQQALNASINQGLLDISRVIREIHDTLDKSLLLNTEKFAKLESREELIEERFAQIKADKANSLFSWWSAAALIVTLVASVVGAVMSAK